MNLLHLPTKHEQNNELNWEGIGDGSTLFKYNSQILLVFLLLPLQEFKLIQEGSLTSFVNGCYSQCCYVTKSTHQDTLQEQFHSIRISEKPHHLRPMPRVPGSL